VTTRQTFALDTTVVNGCNAFETVQIHGKGKIITSTKIQNGTVQVKEIDFMGGTGTGSAGSKYVYGETAKINISTGANPDGTPFSYTERRPQVLVGIGVPDQIITYNIRLVIDAIGNVTTDIFDIKLICH
jgi:hypothetical protein